MPSEGAVVVEAGEGDGRLGDLDEPPEPRSARGSSSRSGLMKPLVVLALPGMYLFYKYSQYRREQRELSRRRVTERELQHLHHKIDKLLTKLEENEPELASSQEDEVAQHGPHPGGPPPQGIPPQGQGQHRQPPQGPPPNATASSALHGSGMPPPPSPNGNWTS